MVIFLVVLFFRKKEQVRRQIYVFNILKNVFYAVSRGKPIEKLF